MLRFLHLPLWLCVTAALAQNSLVQTYRTAPSAWFGDAQGSSTRKTVPLHGTWEAISTDPKLAAKVEIPGAYLWEGEARFQRTFVLDSSAMNKAIRLHAHGINNVAQIEINDEITVSHEGGYTSFTVDLRRESFLYHRENSIIVSVDNRLSPLTTLPAKHRPFGWRSEGGIYREIFLEIMPEIHIAGTQMDYAISPEGVQLKVQAQLRCHKNLPLELRDRLTCVLEIWDSPRQLKVASSAPLPLPGWNGERFDANLACLLQNPLLWSPRSPNLYAVHVALLDGPTLVDELWIETGFRRFEIVNKQFSLNGEPVLLRGTNWIEVYNHQSAVLDSSYLVAILNSLQRMGANTLRVVGHPPHPLLPALCDRAGILLLEELPLYYLTDAHFLQSRFSQLAQLQARDMVVRDQHHPSIVAWGVGAESLPISPASHKAVNDLTAELRRLDERLLYVVASSGLSSIWEPEVDFMLVDWFSRRETEAFVELQSNCSKPMLPIVGYWVNEFAVTSAKKSNQNERGYAEEAQAEYLATTLRSFMKTHEGQGYFLQSLFDWQAPMPLMVIGPASPARDAAMGVTMEGGWRSNGLVSNSTNHPAGVIDDAGQHRLAFQVVQSFNRGDSEPLLVSKRFTTSPPGIFQVAGIAVVLILLYFIQRDRRLRANLRRIFIHPHGFYIDLYENRKVSPFLTILLGLIESCILALLLAQFCYAFRQDLIFDQIVNLLVVDPGWKATLIWLTWNPAWFIAVGTLVFFIAGHVLALLLRTVGFFLGSGLPMVQYVTFVFWVWASVLLLAAIAPIFHRLLLDQNFLYPMLVTVVCVLLWSLGRLFRALRVVYMMSLGGAMIVFVLLFGGLALTVALYYDNNQALFDYVQYYVAVLRAAG